jgi:hypothetical protein
MFAFFLLADFAFFPSANYVKEQPASAGSWDCICGGMIVAQLVLLTLIAALGTGPSLSRQLLSLTLLFFVVLATVAGLFFMDTMVQDVYVLPSEQIGPSLYVIPLLFLASQIPLWGFRIIFHWRIGSPGRLTETAPTVTLSGLILATALVAVSIACARAGQQLYDEISTQSWWQRVLVAMALAITFNLLLTPGMVYCLLRLKSLRNALLIYHGCSWLLCLLWLLVLLLAGTLEADRGSSLVSSTLFFLGLSTGLFVPLLGFRLAGYRLEVNRGKIPSLPANT